MKLSEIKGERAIEVIADLVEPVTEILADPKVKLAARNNNKAKAIAVALKNHPKEVITLLAVLDGENPETYEPSLIEIPKQLLELLNDPELADLFTSAGQTEDTASSAPHSGNTEE